MEKFTNLKIKGINGNNVEVQTFTTPTMDLTLNIEEFNYILKNGKIENEIIYGDFEVVNVRKKPTLLYIGSHKHLSSTIANNVKNIKKPLNDLEVGKVYHSKNSNEAGYHCYLYLGKNYYCQYGYLWGEEFSGYVEDPQIKYGHCFIEISKYQNCFSFTEVPVVLEATPMEIEKFGKHKFNRAMDLSKKIFIFGTKEEVEAKLVEIKLLNK